MLEGWSIHSCKNFFGQMMKSDVRAFQSPYKMQIFDPPAVNFEVAGQTKFLVRVHVLTHIMLK